jgi:hypothetical protein
MKLQKFKTWLDETTFVAGASVTGGETPNNPDDTLYYLNSNIQDADTRDNQLKASVKSMHADLHADPTQAMGHASQIKTDISGIKAPAPIKTSFTR